MKAILPILLLFAIACSPASITPQPEAPATPQPEDEEPEGKLEYSQYTDPLYLAFSNEHNPFGRRTLARLWVLLADLDPPSEAQKKRLQLAQRALQLANEAVEGQQDPCKAGVLVALDRATGTKSQLEQQYLQVSDHHADQSLAAEHIDKQVHLLRDEIEALRELAEPCPPQMFDSPDPSK